MSAIIGLECPECGKQYNADELQTVCEVCDSPLLARYRLSQISQHVDRDSLSQRAAGIWRWLELLPVRHPKNCITLGEGDTPLLHLTRIGHLLGLPYLSLKDEGTNPTSTFKARGLAVAVSKALELGVKEIVIPTAGNAGGALAAYAAASEISAHVFMPADAPEVNQAEVRAYGADLRLVDGLIDQAGAEAREMSRRQGWFDVSTFREPYRVEGKKTMGLELAEAFHWILPDVILYPTGGGTGLVGMWKAFEELEGLGWIDNGRPRMVSVQAEGCAPIVRAWQQGSERADRWTDAHTSAHGIRVPSAYADRLILRALRESGGKGVTVSEEGIVEAQRELAEIEGIFACPEGAATLAGLKILVSEGWLNPQEQVVLFNTGSGLKYV